MPKVIMATCDMHKHVATFDVHFWCAHMHMATFDVHIAHGHLHLSASVFNLDVKGPAEL